MKKICEIEVNKIFEIFILIKSAEVRLTKMGKKFISFIFQDKSGIINGKYWNVSEIEIKKFISGKVVLLNGKKELYQGMLQINIIKMRLADIINEPSNPILYIEKAPISIKEIINELNEYIFKITNIYYQRIVRKLFSKYSKFFFEYPAAKKHHHAFMHGLSFHTLSMLKMGDFICKEYPIINSSLLFSGIILHDLGKIKELSGIMNTEYTLLGNLIGHLVIIDEEIIKVCLELKINDNLEDIIFLRHMVISHHGFLEFGSPIRPKILEAEILYQLDNMDSKINMLLNALNKKNINKKITERIFGLDNRFFYITKK